MTYEFAGFFAYPVLNRPCDLPSDLVWREIQLPFSGIGIRLPQFLRADELPTPDEIKSLAAQLQLDNAASWIYLTYVCWGGEIDFVYGLGSHQGESFGPTQANDHSNSRSVYIELMKHFGVSESDALMFPPFVRGYWGST